jgi:branched-subunit amino acid ABC-type transport system permease component
VFHTLITVYSGGTIATISGLILMVVVLIVKPTGLMGVKVSE